MPVFSDETVSVKYIPTTEQPRPGYAIQAITVEAFQNQIKIIDQVLDTYEPNPGVISNQDTIEQSISKIGATLQNNYKGIHITQESPDIVSLESFERCVIFDAGVNNKTLILRSITDPDVIPWVDYEVIIAAGDPVRNTITVRPGEYLNGVLDGSFALDNFQNSWFRVSIRSDSTGWYVSN